MYSEEDEVDFCDLVAEKVEQWTGYPDGADLCFTLLEKGEIPETASVESAARIVAQHLK